MFGMFRRKSKNITGKATAFRTYTALEEEVRRATAKYEKAESEEELDFKQLIKTIRKQKHKLVAKGLEPNGVYLGGKQMCAIEGKVQLMCMIAVGKTTIRGLVITEINQWDHVSVYADLKYKRVTASQC